MAIDGPHWDFSLAVYGQEGVPPACLLLQDRHGVDVNLLLLVAMKAAVTGLPPDEGGIIAVDDATRPWRENVVRPLRGVRRWLKEAALGPEADALRSEVKRMELQAEKLQQAMLAAQLDLGAGPALPGPHVADALRVVVELAAGRSGPFDSDTLQAIDRITSAVNQWAETSGEANDAVSGVPGPA